VTFLYSAHFHPPLRYTLKETGREDDCGPDRRFLGPPSSDRTRRSEADAQQTCEVSAVAEVRVAWVRVTVATAAWLGVLFWVRLRTSRPSTWSSTAPRTARSWSAHSGRRWARPCTSTCWALGASPSPSGRGAAGRPGLWLGRAALAAAAAALVFYNAGLGAVAAVLALLRLERPAPAPRLAPGPSATAEGHDPTPLALQTRRADACRLCRRSPFGEGGEVGQARAGAQDDVETPMVLKRRGIRLKELSPDDASLQELLDSDLCLPDDPDDPVLGENAEPEGPAMAEVAREVLQGLRETLDVLNEAVGTSHDRRRPRPPSRTRPEGVARSGEPAPDHPPAGAGPSRWVKSLVPRDRQTGPVRAREEIARPSAVARGPPQGKCEDFGRSSAEAAEPPRATAPGRARGLGARGAGTGDEVSAGGQLLHRALGRGVAGLDPGHSAELAPGPELLAHRWLTSSTRSLHHSGSRRSASVASLVGPR